MKLTLEETIKTAKESLLSLQSNWDDEGAKTIDEETFTRGINVLRKLHENIPKIFPSSDGGIDISWKEPEFTLTIRFTPPESGKDDIYFKSNG